MKPAGPGLSSAAIETEIVVIGSGVAGALAAARLAAAGRKVVVLEAGPRVSRAEAILKRRRGGDTYLSVAHAPSPLPRDDGRNYYIQAGPDPFRSQYLRVVGGTTWHWLGSVPRFLPEDFELKTRYGIGVDWPIGYSALEAFYVEAERELGVSGEGDGGSARSAPYPMPAIKQTYLDTKLAEALKALGLKLETLPQARASRSYQGRPACCGSADCIPLCPIQAKYDATVHVALAEKSGARVIENAVAFRLDAAVDGHIRAVHYQRPDRTHGVVTAQHFFLAANSVESAKLLLISRGPKYPLGLANRSGMVGRYLMDHPSGMVRGLARIPVYPYRGPLVTSGIESFRRGEFRKVRAAYRIDVTNDGWNAAGQPLHSLAGKLIASGLRGQALRDAIRDQAARQFTVIAMTEQLPEWDNRVEPDWGQKDALGIPRPKITYRLDDYSRRGLKAAAEVLMKVSGSLAAESESHSVDGYRGAGHLMGTLRMGNDPKQSVVDANLRAHDHPNLYCLGSGVFPTGGTANPTLTLAALTLKAVKTFLA